MQSGGVGRLALARKPGRLGWARPGSTPSLIALYRGELCAGSAPAGTGRRYGWGGAPAAAAAAAAAASKRADGA